MVIASYMIVGTGVPTIMGAGIAHAAGVPTPMACHRAVLPRIYRLRLSSDLKMLKPATILSWHPFARAAVESGGTAST